MNRKIIRSDGSVRNLRIGVVVTMTCITMILSIAGMLFLALNQHATSSEYSQMIDTDLRNRENLTKISKDLYNHEEMIFQYIISDNITWTRSRVREAVAELETELENNLDEFGKNVSGTEYEQYYRLIDLGIKEYLESVVKVMEFADSGNIQEANFYMNSCLNKYIFKINNTISDYEKLVTEDIEETRISMQHKTAQASQTTVAGIPLVVLFSIVSMLTCGRISKKLLTKDSLTCADNFEYFQRICGKLVKKGHFANYTCVFCNIKDFRFYNSKFGYKTGDQVLIDLAQHIKSFLVKGEYFCRDGGDSFSLLIFSEREDQFISHMKDISLDILGRENMIEVYCGLYSIRKDDVPGDAFASCTLALSTARENTSEAFIRYDPQMFTEMDSRMDTLYLCNQGLKNGEFIVYYQPKVNIETNTLCGCEALVRWLHDGKLIPPVKFIGLLEEKGNINALDFYVFRRVCSDISEWLKKGIEPVRVSSNFSKLHLKDPHFADKIMNVINEYGIDPKYVEIELTESSAYDDFKSLAEFVKNMKEQGIFTSMDDFGTGYSSLSMLRDLDVDIIKIDKSFIDDLEKADNPNKKMIGNIVRMIHDLDREVICEGIETKEQVEFLKKINCFAAQGYLYDTPLPHDEFEKRLNDPVYHNK